MITWKAMPLLHYFQYKWQLGIKGKRTAQRMDFKYMGWHFCIKKKISWRKETKFCRKKKLSWEAVWECISTWMATVFPHTIRGTTKLAYLCPWCFLVFIETSALDIDVKKTLCSDLTWQMEKKLFGCIIWTLK